MAVEKFDLLIIYWDGVHHTVTDVTGYGTVRDDHLFYYMKNDFRGFIPIDQVRFFGRRSDYLDKKKKE